MYPFPEQPVNTYAHYERNIGAYAWRPGAIGAERGFWARANLHLMQRGRIKQDRPHLTRYNGEWMCHCALNAGFGKTPAEAYRAHSNMEQSYKVAEGFRHITERKLGTAREDFIVPNIWKEIRHK